MREYLRAFAGIGLAVVLFTVLGKISTNLVIVFNAFSWIVLYFSLTKDEVYGAVLGTICGLLQDAFSLGVFGVAGLTKTVLGFWTGFISRKINVVPVTRNFVFLLIMASFELSLWKFLAHFLFRERLAAGGGLALLQPLATAAIVTAAFQIARRAKGENI
jgi:cell shape-determining protein MreD